MHINLWIKASAMTLAVFDFISAARTKFVISHVVTERYLK